MCGIIGYVGSRPAKDLLLRGLERLEYRGYDSAGIALRENGGLDYVRAVGNLSNLKAAAGPNGSVSNHGLGHTRWATHGAVTEQNAHPLTGCEDGHVAVVLNGIVENFRELKESLQADGHTFHSETDAEVVTHLVERHYAGDLIAAVRAAYGELEGPLRVRRHPQRPSRSARRRAPAVPARRRRRRGRDVPRIGGRSVPRRDAQGAADRRGRGRRDHAHGARFFTEDGEVEHKEIEPIDWDDEVAEKGGYETFMLKEIYEQPDAVRETIGDRARRGKLVLEGIGLTELEIQNLRRIVVVACGTAYHAASSAATSWRSGRASPVEPDIASEWRYRNPVLSKDTLVIGISQSGETADTIAAMRPRPRAGRPHARDHEPARHADHARGRVGAVHARRPRDRRRGDEDLHRAGGAALADRLKLAQVRRTLPEDEIEFILEELYDLPERMEHFLDGSHPIEEIAERHYQKPFFLYLGRHIGLPVALEGALKLKEISYIPTRRIRPGR
jgi:glucosamine--fructose-6-phosphate aminotransferase (isomerizing)